MKGEKEKIEGRSSGLEDGGHGQTQQGQSQNTESFQVSLIVEN